LQGWGGGPLMNEKEVYNMFLNNATKYKPCFYQQLFYDTDVLVKTII